MRVPQAVERLPGALSLGRVRRVIDDTLPGLRGAVEIVLAERPHDAEIEQGLGVARIDGERAIELLERAIRLVHVVVADAEVGARADVSRLDDERLLIPARGVREAL